MNRGLVRRVPSTRCFWRKWLASLGILLLMPDHGTAGTTLAEQLNKSCVFRDGAMWCQDRPTSTAQPRLAEDMAICGSKIGEYAVLPFGPKGRALSEEKKRLDAKDARRLTEKQKWSWLNPTVVDLGLFAQHLECVNKADMDAALTTNGYVRRSPSTPLEQAGVRLVGQYFAHGELSGAGEVTVIIRPPNQGFFERSPADKSRERSIVWVTLHYGTASKPPLTSKEYWIDCEQRVLKLQSDYWDQNLDGRTLPGGERNWTTLDKHPLAGSAQQMLCPAIR